jgi:hypothetical protein
MMQRHDLHHASTYYIWCIETMLVWLRDDVDGTPYHAIYDQASTT